MSRDIVLGGKKKSCLYELLKVDRSVSSVDLKKAYYAMAKKLHPDKNVDDPQAKENFQALQQAYDILKDPIKRKHYDRTGVVDDVDSMDFWQAYERYKSVEITKEDIDNAIDSYHGSEEEEKDVIQFYEKQKGDITHILAWIMGSKDEDRTRFVELLENAIKSKRASSKYKSVLKSKKKNILSLEELDNLDEDLNDEDVDEEEQEGSDEEMKDFIVEDEDDDVEVMEQEEESDHDEDISEDVNNSTKYQIGDEIEARWRKGTKYYPGEIEKINSDGTYQVKYSDDNYCEKSVKESFIREPKKTKKRQPESDQKNTKKKSKKLSKEEEEYDGDLSALIAGIKSKNAVREEGFLQFEKKYSKKK